MFGEHKEKERARALRAYEKGDPNKGLLILVGSREGGEEQ